MGTILILTPIIIANWPAITAAVAGAAVAMGFVVKDAAKEAVEVAAKAEAQAQQRSVEVGLDESQVLAQSVATGEEIVLKKGTIELRVRRDERGRCAVCAKGIGHTDAELRAIAQQFSERMTQCFVYNKVMTEMKAKGFQVVNEEVMDDESVRIHVRRWEA